MTIALNKAGKRFNRDWIFKDLTCRFESGNSYAITGSNGSGKSTLLQVISGSLTLNEGACRWSAAASIPADKIFRHISYCAPYLEVIEEMTLLEFLEFHQRFKPLLPGCTPKRIIEELGLEAAGDKRIQQFSSGMKQRAKLAQCIYSDTAVVILDEPCTNLDQQGIALYYSLIDQYCTNRLVLVGSNDETEYRFCQHRLSIMDYK
ncbi:ABC transporter ATP-binding protein [Niabella ginsenosidivorans]|uniref:ABC transporter ATP-binding protein n=1 Tax=Niabella ginsenosidivorans TaxID=1176587 RepID=A0A1A9HWN8_9BACT|nr:ATP-binding cassette domain-containing protein [Niabella ginsenosidivorans]ANH79653.1 ABC transporter ATP-binding protein [Niabella ginsenosidivorans]